MADYQEYYIASEKTLDSASQVALPESPALNQDWFKSYLLVNLWIGQSHVGYSKASPIVCMYNVQCISLTSFINEYIHRCWNPESEVYYPVKTL